MTEATRWNNSRKGTQLPNTSPEAQKVPGQGGSRSRATVQGQGSTTGNAMSTDNGSYDVRHWELHFLICVFREAHLVLWGQSPRFTLCQHSSPEHGTRSTAAAGTESWQVCLPFLSLHWGSPHARACLMHFYFICNDVRGNLLMTYDPQEARYHWLMKQ